MTSTRPPGSFIYYGIVLALSGVAFLVFLFTIGGGRPSGPGLFLALSVLALGVVARLLYLSARALAQDEEDPVFRERATGARRKELEREYQAIKRALKELELDHAMGKLSDGDHGEIRGRYRERAVRILRQLDQGESYKKQIELDLKARSEAIAARQPKRASEARPEARPDAGPDAKTDATTDADAPAPAEPEADLDAAPAPAAKLAAPAPRAATSAPATRACPACSARNDTDAAFCKKCGRRLEAAAVAKD